MDVLEAIRQGKSASKFKSTPVPEEKVTAIFTAARHAPSAQNLQPWKFIVVSDEDIKQKLAQACTDGRHIADAPLIIVACARLDEAEATVGGYMNSYPLDLGMAMAHVSVTATSEGLATSWVFSFREEKVRSVLQIPEDAKVVGLSPLGFATAFDESTGRKHLSEILSYNRYE